MKPIHLLALGLFLMQSIPAHAYLDPGTGSILLQGLIAGIAAGWAVIQFNLNRIKSFFASRRDAEASAKSQVKSPN